MADTLLEVVAYYLSEWHSANIFYSDVGHTIIMHYILEMYILIGNA